MRIKTKKSSTAPISAPLTGQFAEAARRARIGEYPDAARVLNICFQELQQRLVSSGLDQALLKKVMFSLETLMIMQKQKDWVAVADIIEYELIGVLRQIPGIS